MNTSCHPRVPVLFLFLLPLISAAAPSGDVRPYTLFMGADLSVELGKQFHRVENVSGSDFKVMVDGNEMFVPTRRNPSRLRIDLGLKLAGTSATLDDFVVERSYTPRNDPRRKFETAAGAALGASAAAGISSMRSEQAAASVQAMIGNPQVSAADFAAAEAARDQAARAASLMNENMGSDLNSTGFLANRMETELAKENYDAISVVVRVSAPVPLEDPYLLVIARIHERDTKPGVLRNWIYAEKLESIGPKPSTVRINEGGFPEGYEIEECQVRLYDRGREVPSNLSPKRVDLTRDEARQYVLIERLTAHKDDTLPAAVAYGEPPADLRDHLAAGELTKPYYVKVDADGVTHGAFSDEACTRPVDDSYVDTLVADLLFAPALDKGKPVDGVARVQLGTLLN